MADTLTVFAVFGVALLSASSTFLAYLLFRETTEQNYETSLLFLLSLSSFMFFSSLLSIIRLSFQKSVFVGIQTQAGASLFLLFAVISLHGVIWQFNEYSGD